MKHLAIPLFTFAFFLHLFALAAVPLRWTVETSAANPATFDQFAGATYDLEAALQSRGKPLAVSGEPQLFWQTNGMGSAWWTAPATVSGNVLRATWTPACDVGAKTYNCFIGITGTTYNAAFQLRLRPSPGATPNELPLPQKVIDFARVTVLNPPWSGGGSGGVDTNAVVDIVRKTVDGAAKMLPKYLWCMDFDDSYPDDAAWYYAQPQDYGSCSAVRDGGFFYRNYDWRFDGMAEFVVRMSAGPGRFASVGVANCGTNLTDETVASGKPSRYFKCLPGRTVDGVNENGVCAEVNVVGGDPGDRWDNPDGDIHPLAPVRWALDNATSAGMAASNLASRIAFPPGWSQNFHWMLADSAQTWIVEDGTAHKVDGRAVMTNFELYPTPVFGPGWERYVALTNGVNITNVWFTNAYSIDADWLSEFSDLDEMNQAKIAWNNGKGKESHRGQHYGDNWWWQTVHSSVYDMTNLTLRICVQETPDWYVFAIPGATGVSPVAVREIVEPIVGAATNGIPEQLAALQDGKRDMTDLNYTHNNPPWIIQGTDFVLTGSSPSWESQEIDGVRYLLYYYYDIWYDLAKEVYGHTIWNAQHTTYGEETSLEFDTPDGFIALIKESGSDAIALVSQLPETAKAVFESNTNPTNTVFSNAVTTVVQNSGLQEDFARRFRTFGDEYVYQASRFSPFTWTGMRADAVEAIGNTQPTPDYEYGGYTEWICSFEMDGHTYWGSSYSPTAAPNAEFYFYADYYDESRGEWVYDELSLTASRTAIEYEKTNPIDTFARQSELTEVSTGVAQLNNRINGETKVLRSGKAGELGTGWGYLQSSLDGDYRNWRIRVPAWTNLSGNETNKTQSGMTYVTWTNGNQRSVGYSVVLNNPLSWTPGWDFARTVRETRGAEGVDAVQQADYDVGIQTRGSNVSGGKSYFINYITTQDADYDFHTTAVTTGWTPTNRVYWVGSGTSAAKVTVPGYFRPIDYRVEREWTLSSGSEHEDIARVSIDIRGLFISETDLTTHQSVMYSFNVICENERLSVVRTDGDDETTLLDETLHDTVHGVTITADCTSSSVENVYAPYYKLVGSLDSGLFYDPGLDCTFRIAVTNGCFHSDKYCDGDWRK